MKNIKKITMGILTVLTLCSVGLTTVSAAAPGERTLSAGMAGDDVRQLQTALKGAGHSVETDGVYGPKTGQAVKKIEQSFGVQADGVARPAVVAALTKQETPLPAGSEPPKEYQESIDIVATAYAPGPHDNDQWGSLTHLGTEVRPGIIAVDPRVIPLGSRVYIEFANGSGYFATAEDTGGAIKGNRVDIAMATVSQAEDFGIQSVKVYVLD